MKHSQYEHWILDDQPLTESEFQDLANHLRSCEHCQKIQVGWIASRQQLSKVQFVLPNDGFVSRWQTTMQSKCQIEKVQRYRLTIFSIITMAMGGFIGYLWASGSFTYLFANLFNSLTGLFFAITNGLASLGYVINRLPSAFPVAIGFLIFGFINAFFVASMFTLWNIKQKELVVNEVTNH